MNYQKKRRVWILLMSIICQIALMLVVTGCDNPTSSDEEQVEDSGVRGYRASDGNSDDNFGRTVSVSGDYAIIGAYGEDGGTGGPEEDCGAAYIFKREGAIWTQQAILHASDMHEGDWFGYSVSIDGDYAIIGAKHENGGSSGFVENCGAAYIFKRDGANWTQQAILHASDRKRKDYFGNSVSISGDYAVIGADFQDGEDGHYKNDCGAAYIFKRDGVTWNQQAILHADDMQENDWFGFSVSIDGDYAIVGAEREDGADGDPEEDCGAAYIFKRNGTAWTQQSTLHSDDNQRGDNFGRSVSISGDYVIIGAYEEDGGDGTFFNEYGAAYIFKRDGTTWTEQVVLHAHNKNAYDFFGFSASVDNNCFLIGSYAEKCYFYQ